MKANTIIAGTASGKAGASRKNANKKPGTSIPRPKASAPKRAVLRAAAASADESIQSGFVASSQQRLSAGGNLTPRQREIFYHLMASYPGGVFVEGDRPAIDAFCQLVEMREAALSRAEELGAYSPELPRLDDGTIDMKTMSACEAAINTVHRLSAMVFTAASRVRAAPNTRLAFSDGHEGMLEQMAAERAAGQQNDVLGDISRDIAKLMSRKKA